MSRIIIVAILIIFIAALAVNVVILFKSKREMQIELDKMRTKIEELTKENNGLQAQVDYFSRPENLEKEFRARFNYKSPGEEMMIVVP